ncbi:hypothetical protein [Nocardia sp. NPDC051981]|uniref:hypothetical protein n=1 Tax=Nocardia sp. NPDC051981 TaxID=3155417 RepID=UPI00341DDAB1
MRIDRVGFASVADGEHPHLRRQFRGHVDDGLPVGDQPVRHMPADTVATLDRPHTLRESLCGGQAR